jgi:hypothetical protein
LIHSAAPRQGIQVGPLYSLKSKRKLPPDHDIKSERKTHMVFKWRLSRWKRRVREFLKDFVLLISLAAAFRK